MKDILWCLFYLLIGCVMIWLTKWVFEIIYFSDMPLWIKYFLLN